MSTLHTVELAVGNADYELAADSDGFLQVHSGGPAEVVFYEPDAAEVPADSAIGIVLRAGDGVDTSLHSGNAYARAMASGKEVRMTFTAHAA